MDATENNAEINWTKRKEWGSEGLTHRLLVVVGEDTWSFTVDQPTKGQWVARGWHNNHLSFYREGSDAHRTLSGVKELVERHVGELKIEAAKLAAQEDELRGGAVDSLAVGLDLPAELIEQIANTPATGQQLTGRWSFVNPQLIAASGKSWTTPPSGPSAPSPEALAATLGLSDGPDEPECWCEWVDIGVGMQRVTDNPECPEHNPEMYERWGEALTGVIELRSCGCPTPTHRMSCGAGAVPQVVSS